MKKPLQYTLIFTSIILFLFHSCSKDEKVEQFKLITNVNPTEGGTVTPSEGTFDSGADIKIAATPTEGYEFKNWDGDLSGNLNPASIEFEKNTTITANFKKIDSDGDGVPDTLDQCQQTPTGSSVDAEGCADSEKDTDGDGVTDDLDNCPSTESGTAVDANGCSDANVDSDGDGIDDETDQCPDTPSGETVDNNGCSATQNDTDGDGVPDELDQCSNTPSGEIVDVNGCSDAQNGTDSDGDGITDNLDECPDTQDGASVNANGCSSDQTDTDGDGVTDNLDQCSDTANGVTVDENGCSAAQIDTDGDSVTDDLDQCPDTQQGETVDENGCADNQKDTDGDGVNDSLDQCPATPENENVDDEGCTLAARTYVPDDKFEQQLIDLGYDDVLDDYVLTENINTVESLSIEDTSNQQEIDVTGLQDFRGLTSLNIGATVGTIDLSNHPFLNLLTIAYGEVEELFALSHPNISEIRVFKSKVNNVIIDNCVKLPGLNNVEDAFYGNVILSNLPLITWLGGIDNSYGYAKIENCPRFRGVGIDDGGFGTLEIINCDGLEELRMQTWPGQSYRNIILRNNFNLTTIRIDRNRVQTLDISENNSIKELELVLNEITSLDLSANTNLETLIIQDEFLSCIKVNEDQLTQFSGSLTIGSNIELSLDCN